jgi:hypothetical protein
LLSALYSFVSCTFSSRVVVTTLQERLNSPHIGECLIPEPFRDY